MKFLASLATTTILGLATTFATAQQGSTVAYGRTVINFSTDFQQNLSNLGASLTDLNLHPFANGVAVFPITQGVVDLKSAVGELNSNSGYAVSAGGAYIKIQNLTTDLSNPNSPVITGVFVINGTVVGRQAIFNMQIPSGFSLPLQPSNGVEQINAFGLTLATQAANTINGVFGGPVLQAGANIGTADIYTVLASAGTIY